MAGPSLRSAFLDADTLRRLIGARASDRQATAYRSSHDGLPEPLCAIYEPASREPIAAYVAGGKHCPRKFRFDRMLICWMSPIRKRSTTSIRRTSIVAPYKP